MIVIADTTPISHLILVGRADFLRELYGEVIIPSGVLHELQNQAAPKKIRDWIGRRPSWLDVRRVLVPNDPTLFIVDRGEREAIALAEKLGADLLLMDDRSGRREAQRRGLMVTGTLTVLYLAAERGLETDFPGAVQQLQLTGFRASPAVIEYFLNRHAQRAHRLGKKR
ncbi:MAG TPA: DUF3368 domain-containing protein [Terriglobia bacterium]|nr:DUF3368 domain-containing protein [Terriglobia bacterium]